MYVCERALLWVVHAAWAHVGRRLETHVPDSLMRVAVHTGLLERWGSQSLLDVAVHTGGGGRGTQGSVWVTVHIGR